MNKTVNELKATAHAFLRVTPIQPDEAIWRLIADASLANIENKSQGGFHLALVHQSILDGASGTSSINSWKSHKLKRVVKATLGSEALAMDDALAEVEWLRALWNEVLKSCQQLTAPALEIKNLLSWFACRRRKMSRFNRSE